MRAILAVRGSGAIRRNALCSIRVRVKMRSSEILLLAITAVRRQRVVRFNFGTYALMGPLHWVHPFCFPAATHPS